MRIADTKSWNDAFEGATPMRPFPLRLDEIEHRVRKFGGVDDLRVVDQHSLATREPDPTAVLGVEALGDEVEDIVGERAEQTLLIEIPDGAGRLGQEHVGRRLVALLPDQQRQIRGVAVPRLDRDPGLLRERSRIGSIRFWVRPE